MRPTLFLATASPRRRAFLEALGVPFDSAGVAVDESPRAGEAPAAYVRRLARAKAAAGSARAPASVVLAADTAVVLDAGDGHDEEILGKPEDAEDAHRMLRLLSGRRHRVLTGLAVAFGGEIEDRVVTTVVQFRRLDPDKIAWYVGTGEPLDKAGAYGIQGLAGWMIERIEGSHSNVIGLPLPETAELLAAAGLPLPWDADYAGEAAP
ncbi:MAG: Maf family protein [Deltaproteobacteria bacterium]|nr:Maf family protein [Deltaproteobacteria bacterium]